MLIGHENKFSKIWFRQFSFYDNIFTLLRVESRGG